MRPKRRQVGLALLLVAGLVLLPGCFGVTANPRYPGIEPVPETVLINPKLAPLSQEEEDGWEGCLSVPGMRGWGAFSDPD